MWRVVAVAVAVGALGCANAGTPSQGGGGQDVDARPTPHDAHMSEPIDAPHGTTIDAPHGTIDAPHGTAIDAPAAGADGGILCNDDSTCGTGNCCFDLGSPPGFCVPGESVLGVCVPSSS